RLNLLLANRVPCFRGWFARSSGGGLSPRKHGTHMRHSRLVGQNYSFQARKSAKPDVAKRRDAASTQKLMGNKGEELEAAVQRASRRDLEVLDSVGSTFAEESMPGSAGILPAESAARMAALPGDFFGTTGAFFT